MGFNPFTEVAGSDAVDIGLIEQAKNGDRAALEKLVLRHQAWIYNITVRMVFNPHDAEEVTQEVLIKFITKLTTFKGESRFRTWLYRIVANHVLNMRCRGAEAQTFADYGAAINATPDEGHTHQGRNAIQRWKTEASVKYQYTCEPFACEDGGGRFVITSRLTGNFPGSPIDLRFYFALEGDKIALLVILP